MFFFRIEDLKNLLNICVERSNLWKESFWIIYQISSRQDCALLNENLIKHLFRCLSADEDIVDIKCLVPILRTFGNVIAVDNGGYSANEFIIGLKTEGSAIKNILVKNRHVNLNDECAWLLGNVLKVLNITNLNENGSLSAENLNEICNYFFV